MKRLILAVVATLAVGCEKKPDPHFQPYTGSREVVRIEGKVIAVHPQGVAIAAEGDRPPPVTRLGRVGAASSAGVTADDDGRPPREEGTFLLTKHPNERQLTEGETVDVDAVQVATYRFHDPQNALHVWKNYEALPLGTK